MEIAGQRDTVRIDRIIDGNGERVGNYQLVGQMRYWCPKKQREQLRALGIRLLNSDSGVIALI
jgi:hypothetical protein